ncbi:MAG: hypothetical protein ABI628_00145 [Chloroflexota bacterium]
MNSAKEGTVHPDNDFFVVRRRLDEERTRVRAENLANALDRPADRAEGSDRPRGARVRLGRRLVTVGTVLAGDPAATEPHSTTGQPC